MGTRADFYVGRGEQAEWLGSIAWDGYADGIAKPLLSASTEPEFREAVDQFLTPRKDATRPEQGWPWPWNDSATTDYAYAFDGGKVHASCFGGPWFDPTVEQVDDEPEGDSASFPDMSARKAVTFGQRSGVMIIRG